MVLVDFNNSELVEVFSFRKSLSLHFSLSLLNPIRFLFSEPTLFTNINNSSFRSRLIEFRSNISPPKHSFEDFIQTGVLTSSRTSDEGVKQAINNLWAWYQMPWIEPIKYILSFFVKKPQLFSIEWQVD